MDHIMSNQLLKMNGGDRIEDRMIEEELPREEDQDLGVILDKEGEDQHAL